jgi:hypothetical protein
MLGGHGVVEWWSGGVMEGCQSSAGFACIGHEIPRVFEEPARNERAQQSISWHSNMKRTWSIFFGLLLLAAPAAVQAQFTFLTNADNTLTITGYSGAGGAVSIPTNINGLAVTSIGNYAFEGNSSLASITLPGSVTSIGDAAFEYTGLAGVTIPDGVASIGNEAFAYCARLAGVTLPGSVTSIGAGAFEHTGLTNITIPENVPGIGDETFAYCSNLGSVTIPGSVTSIGAGAFYSCSNLASLTIPGSVSSIGDNAFNYSGLASLTIPQSVTSIGNEAFAYCSSLASVTNLSRVTNIGAFAFYSCSSLASVTIPDSVTSIGDDAFKNTALASLTIPESVTSIGSEAFAYCSSLASLTIPGGVTNIGAYAFEYSGLASVTIPESLASIGDDTFAYCASLGSVTIPGSVTNIGAGAFFSCGSLTSITIPGSVTSIGNSAFQACTRLSSVYFESNAPAVGLEVFNSDNNATIYYVPGTTGWGSTFAGLPANPPPSLATQPTNQSVVLGSNVTLQVTAAGPGPLAYQWRFNGAKLANGSHVSGATSNSLTLTNVTTNYAGRYEVVVTNLFGSITSSIATVTVVVPPSITTQPANTNQPPGGLAAFSVRAAGTPLNYIWSFDGQTLSDNANISGSASNKMTIHLVALNNVGSYSVVVSNLAGSVTSRVAQLVLGRETNRPSVAITSPRTNSRVAAPVLSGTASDAIRVQSVNYWVTNVNNGVRTTLQGQAALAAGTASSSNWTIQAALLPGTNILAVQSFNYSGKASLLTDVHFFLKAPARLTVTKAGTGSGAYRGTSFITGDAVPTNGAMLNVGEGYAITATPDTNNFFDNWAGSSGQLLFTNGRTLTFIMESNTSLTANFTSNIFVRMAGTYNGLFSSDALGVTEETAGMIGNFTLGRAGGYSAKVYLGGAAPSIAGTFSHDGYATNRITNALDKVVTVELFVNADSSPRAITGLVIGTNSVISDGISALGWTSTVNLIASTNNTRADSGAYTVLIPPPAGLGTVSGFPLPTLSTNTGGGAASHVISHTEGAALPRGLTDPVAIGNSPPGYGFLLLTNNPGTTPGTAIVKITGALADGTALSQTVPIGEDNGLPVYVTPYGAGNAAGNGLLFGKLSLDSAPSALAPSGTLTWIKKAAASGLYGAGFTNSAVVAGSYWSNSIPLTRLIPETPVLLWEGGLSDGLWEWLSPHGTNLVPAVGTASLGPASINTNTGQLTVMFTNGIQRTAFGAVLQGVRVDGTSPFGGGFFLMGATNIGALSLQPLPP